MPESQAPDEPSDRQVPIEASLDDFEKTLKGLYGDVEWSEQDKHFLRASGLI